MKVFTAFLFVFLFVGILVLGSCNGSTGSPPDAKKSMIGKWKIVKITTEENYTQVAGAADDNNIVVIFNADGTGTSSSVSGGSAFKWELANRDTYLNIADSASNVMSLLLTKVSAGSFTVKDTSTHPAQYEIFKKQNDK